MLSYMFIITGNYYNYYFICNTFHFKQINTNYLIISRVIERMSYINKILNTGNVKKNSTWIKIYCLMKKFITYIKNEDT